MKAMNVNAQQMKSALNAINKKYDGNVVFKRFDKDGSGYNFTLTVQSSKGKGHRIGFQPTPNGNQKRLAAACWHVHGDYFDALFAIEPKAVVRAQGRKIDATQGNWQDWNIGSQMRPMNYSEACECDSLGT